MSAEMKKISFICGSKQNDGIYRGGLALFESLRESGYEINWYQCTDRDKDREFPSHFHLVRGTYAFNKNFSMGFNRLLVFPRKLKNIRGDILFLLDPTLLGILGRHTTTVVKVHDLRALTKYSDNPWTRLMFMRIIPKLKHIDHIIVTTKYMRGMLENFGIASSKIHVLYDTSPLVGNGSEHIDISLKRITEEREVRILYVATDRDYKNIKFFINVAKNLETSNRQCEFRFDIVSVLRDSTKKLLDGLPDGLIQVHSNVRDVSKIYESADVMLFPSLYEGFGLPVIEAMSFGIPVIANDIPPLREILGEGGTLIGVNRMDDWIKAVIDLSNPTNYKVEALKSLNRFVVFSKERFKSNALSIFQEL